jgi:hypothetical protein
MDALSRCRTAFILSITRTRFIRVFEVSRLSCHNVIALILWTTALQRWTNFEPDLAMRNARVAAEIHVRRRGDQPNGAGLELDVVL